MNLADSEFYPHISIDGTLGWSAQNLGHLFEPSALNGNVGPTFQWNLLNYGRLLNNLKFQDARFQELIATYQNTVLTANQDVENGLVQFLKGQERTSHQQASVDNAVKAVNIALKQYQAGTADFTTVTQVQQIQVQQQDLLAQAEGEIAAGLIQVYRALGGGWQIRLQGCNEELPPPGAALLTPRSPESIPAPRATSPLELPTPQPIPPGSSASLKTLNTPTQGNFPPPAFGTIQTSQFVNSKSTSAPANPGFAGAPHVVPPTE